MATVGDNRAVRRFVGIAILVISSGVFATPRILHGWHEFEGLMRYTYVFISIGAISIFVFGMSRHIWVWSSGRWGGGTLNIAHALQRIIGTMVLQKKVVRKRVVGSFHALLFWSFGTLFLIFSLPLFGVDLELVPGLIIDFIFAVFIVSGTFLALRLILVTRTKRDLGCGETLGRVVPPALLAMIGISHFIAQINPAPQNEFVHYLLVMCLFAIIPFSRLLHIVAVPVWLLVRPDTRLSLSVPFNLSNQSEDEITAADIPLGPRKREEFPGHMLVAFDACTRCNRCEDDCPANGTGDGFSPASLMKDLQKTNTLSDSNKIVTIAEANQVGACTTCGRCEEACPVGLDPLSVVVESRRALAYEGHFEAGQSTSLRQLAASSSMWNSEKTPPSEIQPSVVWPPDPASEPPELVYWVGCAGRHDPRAQKISSAVASLLNRAGIRWTTPGANECCTGDAARRMGDEGLFQKQALGTLAVLEQARCKRVLVHCAHCFNAFAKEYGTFGADLEVIHHSELLNELVREGRLGSIQALPSRVAFHDPCYLGRHNGRFDAPRELIDNIPGLERVELAESREQSRCCGAGGGRIWREDEPGAKMADRRAAQAAESEAQLLVTGCNFCLSMLEDPAAQDGVRTLDIAELLADAVR
ncbi:MAG TPA: 4Fe-4S dicluster domain-containing protein [Halieaceae bacterium]|nr:4Fe-4S dicluster domain-containing protein [Halieaceae bacterium]